MKFVYQLQATGADGHTGGSRREIRSSTVFTTAEAAQARVEKFKQTLIDGVVLAPEYPIEIKIVGLEIVE